MSPAPRPALSCGPDQNRQAAYVVQRQDCQPPVPVTVLEHFSRSGRRSLEVCPGEDYAFRVAPRSRCVDDGMRRIDVGGITAIMPTGGQCVEVQRSDAQIRLVAGTENQRNSGVDNLMSSFSLGEPGIDGQQHGPRSRYGPYGPHCGEVVSSPQGNPGTVLDSRIDQCTGRPAGLLVELGKGDPMAIRDQTQAGRIL